jgi:hypothetical protein
MARSPYRSRGAMALLAGGAIIAVAGCAGVTTPPSTPAATSSLASPASATASSTGSPVPGNQSSLAPAMPTANASPAVAGPQNLVAGPDVKASLVAAFAAYKQLPLTDVVGPLPRSLYYGYLPSTGTYWAIADFGASASAPIQVQIGMQDGGSTGIFSRSGGQAWHVSFGGMPVGCPAPVPAGLLSLWGLHSPSGAPCP